MDVKTIGLIVVAVAAVVGFALAGYFAVKPPMTVTIPTTVTSTSPVTTTTTVTTTIPTTVTTTITTTTVMQQSSVINMTPELIPVGVKSIMVNASKGATLRLGNIIVIIRPGTYVMTPSGQILSVYNFSIIDYEPKFIGSPPKTMGEEPVFAFAYAVNGHVSPGYTFVNQEGKPYAVVTVVRVPSTWITWTWLGFMQESNGTLVGGHYAFLDSWVYAGSGIFVNYQFVKPVPWIFVNTGMPTSSMVMYTKPTMPNSTEITTMKPELVPVGIGTLTINATQGGAVSVGNLIAIILPGTYVKTPSGQILKTYNFSLVYQALMNIPTLNESEVYYWPLFAYAFAVNNQINPGYTFVNATGSPTPVLTVAFLPPWFTSWTWLGYTQLPDGVLLGGKYMFPDTWILGDDYMVNVVFVKPVPWVFLAVEHGYVNMTNAINTATLLSGYSQG